MSQHILKGDEIAVDSLLEFAILHEKLYKDNPRDNYMSHVYAKDAMACALKLDSDKRTFVRSVGPFVVSSCVVTPGQKIRILPGSTIYSYNPSCKVRIHKTRNPVKVEHVIEGYVYDEYVHDAQIRWAGRGGYWNWCSPNDLLLSSI